MVLLTRTSEALIGLFPLMVRTFGRYAWFAWAYRRIVLTGGSAAIAAIAGVWLVERAFDVTLFSALASGLGRG